MIRLYLALTLWFFTQVSLAAVPPHIDREIRTALHGTSIRSIATTPIKGLYEVKAGRQLFYTDVHARYLMIGHLYDLKTQTDLTARAMMPKSVTQKISWAALMQLPAIVSGAPHGKPLAVFVDPNCPYCRKLVKALHQDGQLRVSYYLYPLGSLHPGSIETAKAILCRKDKASALFAHMIKGAAIKASCDSYALQTILTFGHQHGFNGTPILIKPDGEVHWGYLPVPMVKRWLAKKGDV